MIYKCKLTDVALFRCWVGTLCWSKQITICLTVERRTPQFTFQALWSCCALYRLAVETRPSRSRSRTRLRVLIINAHLVNNLPAKCLLHQYCLPLLLKMMADFALSLICVSKCGKMSDIFNATDMQTTFLPTVCSASAGTLSRRKCPTFYHILSLR